MRVTQFQVDLSDPVDPKMVVDGEDVTDRVEQLAVVVGRNELPKLVVTMSPGAGSISGSGVVEVHNDEDQVARWLGNINPEALEQAMLKEWSDSTGKTALAVLGRWALGQP